ncbi:MAG: glycosyltransferase [Candidatus Omnitrophica bacterium]|nr:glycosyltransferase [Candidatus Omnitrophota bacterium]
MNKNAPYVSLITVNYNGQRFLKKYFDSLHSLKYPAERLETIMVDNGSKDSSIDYVRKNFPRVKILKNDVNNYCRANNLGIKKAKGQYIGLINNDTVLKNDWLAELVNFMNRDKSIGAVTGKILFPDGKIQGAGHFELPNFYWSDRGFKEEEHGQYDQCEEVVSISHCASLYRKKCLKDIGLLDEDFGFYMEDVDMSIRAKEKGWRFFYVPQGIVYHEFHGTGNEDLAEFYCERNRLMLIAKHYPHKLANELFGRGYFTLMGQKDELMKILPEILIKMLKHYDYQTLMELLPGIFATLGKILNLEKDTLVKQMDVLRNDLWQKEQLFKQQDKETISLREAIQQVNQMLSCEKDSFVALTSRTQDQQKQLEAKDTQLQKIQEKIHEEELRLESLTRLIQEQQIQLQVKETQLQEIQKYVGEKDIRLENVTRLAQEQQKQLEAKEAQLQEIQKEVHGKEDQLEGLTRQTQEQQKRLEVKEAQLQQIQKEIYEKEDRLEGLTRQTQGQQRQIQDQQRRLEEKEARLDEQEDCLTYQNLRLESLKKQTQEQQVFLDHKEGRIQELNAQINNIYNSETYRFLVQPLWWVCSFFKFARGPVQQLKGLLARKVFKGKLSLGLFSAESNTAIYGKPNHYTLKVTNGDVTDHQVKAVIDIYSYDDVASNKHYGYFAIELICRAQSSMELNVEYDWIDRARFILDGSSLKTHDLWKGNLDQQQLYKVNALLYCPQSQVHDQITLIQRLKK